jgi:hypothetical protein
MEDRGENSHGKTARKKVCIEPGDLFPSGGNCGKALGNEILE